MRFRPLAIRGAYLIDTDAQEDERGSFCRAYCAAQFSDAGLDFRVVQTSLSSNRRANTLRGMHFAASPASEQKLVRCVHGAVFDVLLDLRGDEPTFRTWTATELSADNRQAVLVPPGVAHGYVTLSDDSVLLYEMSEEYRAELGGGVRYDDPSFGIAWPVRPEIISPRDRSYPDFVP